MTDEELDNLSAQLRAHWFDGELIANAIDALKRERTQLKADLAELTEPISDAGHTVADGLRAEIERWRGLAERRGTALTFLMTTITDATDETRKRLLNDSPPGRDVCFARQFSDRMRCLTCDQSWDVNDLDPPKCDPKLLWVRARFRA